MSERGDVVRRLVVNAARFSGLAPLLRRHLGSIGAILALRGVTATEPAGVGLERAHTISPDFLDAAISDMKRQGYRFVPLDEALERLAAGRRLPLFATVTADFGYRNLLSDALPVLESHSAPVTIYVCPGLTSGAVDMWWLVLERIVATAQEIYLTTSAGRVAVDASTPPRKMDAWRRIRDWLLSDVAEGERQQVVRDIAVLAGVDPAQPGREVLMTWDELRAAAASPLVTIGAMPVNHRSLHRLGDDEAWYEMVDAARIIEMELGRKPRHFAFAWGDEAAVGPREVEFAAAAGYASAVTARESALLPSHGRNMHALPRLLLDGRRQNVAYLRALLSGVGAVAGGPESVV
jgi:peptidoglycan/xylan/chitin deacetylase (PgdA/CDA1 family)